MDVSLLVEAINKYGPLAPPLAIMGYLWWAERQERIECQKKIEDLLRASLTSTGQLAAGMASMTEAVRVLIEDTREKNTAIIRLIQSLKRSA